MPSVLVVDDEPPARQRLLDLLSHRPDVQTLGAAEDGAAALASLARQPADIVFLDVQMPGVDGFQVIESLLPGPVPVAIFVTAHDRYALRAFDVHALDFLLKPFSDQRFNQSLDRGLQMLQQQARAAFADRLIGLVGERQRGGAAQFTSRILVRDGGRIVFVDADDIDYLEAAGVYVQIHSGTRELLHREALATLESRLDPERFVRIHRSTVVNLDRVAELHPHGHGEYVVLLRNGRRLKLSRNYRARLEQRLKHRL